MAKKEDSSQSNQEKSGEPEAASLGDYLTNIRKIRKLTLREVERASGGEVSNAYLSQLETHTITRPSPNVLHALAKVYSVPYETLMEKAGYITPSSSPPAVLRSTGPSRHGKVATFANENLTKDEEERLVEYLAFLRSRRNKRGKSE